MPHSHNPGAGARTDLGQNRPPVNCRVRRTEVCWACALALLGATDLARGQEPPFAEVAADSGIEFFHFNGMSGELYFAENVGAGLALIDFDNDGDLDVYLRQGVMMGKGKTVEESLVPVPATGLGDRLFRNELAPRSDKSLLLSFVDITAASGIDAKSYGMGVAAADYDNDGWVDLYLTNLEDNQLWHNEGDGTFTQVTSTAAVNVDVWSVSATFVDYDRDGWLDLYVTNYVDFSVETHKPCFTESSARDYCGPGSYNPLPDRLFRNRGDGTFEDASGVSGIAGELGAGLGVIAADINLDGWPDLYVANDQTPNQLWINQGNSRFTNDAVLAGVAVNMDGAPEASMGVDVADFDGDGDEDIFLTHLRRQTNTIYINEGDGWFTDRTLGAGLGAPSFSYTSFGTAWIDYDNDGLLDLLIANGAVQTIEALALADDPYPLHQINQLFRNVGGGRFEEKTGEAGEAFSLSEVTRGAAFGDLDNDGDIDVALSNNNGPARLLRNQIGNRNAWIGLRLLDPERKRDAAGTRVAVRLPGGKTIWRRVRADGSYASANDARILVGLGEVQEAVEVRVVWPDQSTERWSDLPLQRFYTLLKGGGRGLADEG
jgi:hypothetical protein